MTHDEMTEQTLLNLLREPLEVEDAGFTQGVLQHLPALAPPRRDTLWPAWLFAAAGVGWLWQEEGIAPQQQWLHGGDVLLESLQQLAGRLATIDVAAAQGTTLWIPVALALVLLVTLMQLVED